MVSTGVDRFWTRPGIFQIQKKVLAETMGNSVRDDFYFLEDVPWTMYFDQAARPAWRLLAYRLRLSEQPWLCQYVRWGCALALQLGQCGRHRLRLRPIRQDSYRSCTLWKRCALTPENAYGIFSPLLDPWCSGQTCGPVKAEIAGSNPVGSAANNLVDPGCFV